MKEKFTLAMGKILRLGVVCGIDLTLPGAGHAAWTTHGHAAVQPVLITALALTSLVLFLIYIFTRRQETSKTSHLPKSFGAEPDMDKALETLFDCRSLPMAKLSLDGRKVLDVTPSLLTSLGVDRQSFMEKPGEAPEVFPKDAESRNQLLARGWTKVDSRIFNRNSGDWERCRILSFVCRSSQPPCILSIVSGLPGKPSSEPLPGFISDLLDNGTIIQ